MMNQDKKSILQEIEVLIRSIKVHYDNLENESRIPTIELELITSKIRKLHEKSIIYNHLHYLEEEQNQLLKRLKQEEDKGMKTPPQSETSRSNAPTVTTTPQVAQAPVAPPSPPPAPEPKIHETPAPAPPPTQPAAVDLPSEEKKQEPTVFKKDTHINLGLNDRIWLTRELFNGNAEDLNLAINTLKNSSSSVEFNQHLQQLKAKFSWKDDEAEDAFKSLFSGK